MDWDLPDDEAVTVAGLVIHEAQTIPEVGQTLTFHRHRFQVLRREAQPDHRPAHLPAAGSHRDLSSGVPKLLISKVLTGERNRLSVGFPPESRRLVTTAATSRRMRLAPGLPSFHGDGREADRHLLGKRVRAEGTRWIGLAGL